MYRNIKIYLNKMEDLFLLIPELCLDLFLLAWGTSMGARQFGFGWWWSPLNCRSNKLPLYGYGSVPTANHCFSFRTKILFVWF